MARKLSYRQSENGEKIIRVLYSERECKVFLGEKL